MNDKYNMTEQIILSNRAGLEDKSHKADLSLIPKLLVNDYTKGTKVISEIITELRHCTKFDIATAFITTSGVTTLLPILQELESKNIPGRIITTNYLTFSEPKALKKLLNFKNITIKVYTKDNFHVKGYIFKHTDYYKIVIGSSNITQSALTKNEEWNMRISSLTDGLLTDNVVKEFTRLWNNAEPLTYEWLKIYEEVYKKQHEFARQSRIPSMVPYKLVPNKIQEEAIRNLQILREENRDKALVISATGTGKTYLSAFELKQFNPKKALFVVHRERIARQALKSFRKVFEDTKSLGLLIGQTKETDRDIIFSTVQTLYKDETLQSFNPEEFDYIIIDEVHKAGAPTYQKIVNYFKPKFLLGLTATPERNDDFDIFKMFDYNIAYEIRLKQALEENILCPFHYFGISDIEVSGEVLDEQTDFKLLTSEERVKHIIDKIEFYGYSGDRVKGLIFCSRSNEGKELSELFNQRGYRTVALTNEDSSEKRDKMIERLEQEENNDNALDYIFTVDIFNEGVDIPAVNQVVMLRPTQSSIVFVQQLGRGLRKYNDKEYVVIIDFVGSYKNNFMIPIALSGDRSYNKDTLRKYVVEGSRIIPGCSTVNFDAVTKERIFESIDKTSFTDIKLIKEKYIALKQKLGRIPKVIDFDIYDSINPIRIFESSAGSYYGFLRRYEKDYRIRLNEVEEKFIEFISKKLAPGINPIRIFESSAGSYYGFLRRYEKDYRIRLNEVEEKFIEFISKKLAPGKRPHELMILKLILEGNKDDLMLVVEDKLEKQYNIKFKPYTTENVTNVLTNKFATGIKLILEGNKDDLMLVVEDKLEKQYNIKFKPYTTENVTNVLTNKFATGIGKDTYKVCILVENRENKWMVSHIFKECLENADFKEMVKDLVDFGLQKYEENYSNFYEDTSLVLNEKYTYEDVCRLLEWPRNEVPSGIGGYKYNAVTNTIPVFVSYQKDDSIPEAINYEHKFLNQSEIVVYSKPNRKIDSPDIVAIYTSEENNTGDDSIPEAINYEHKFLNQSEIVVYSKPNRKIDSPDIVAIYTSEENNTGIYLFVRKSKKGDKDAKEFYFLGRVRPVGIPVPTSLAGKPVIEIRYRLDNPVSDVVFEYLTSSLC